MWVFTPFGFFSVVRHRERPDHVLIRARARADLVALKKRLIGKTTIRKTPRADYPYRLEATKGAFAQAMHAFVLEELDYPNFKSEVALRQGHHRASVYHDVWSDIMNVEDAGARSGATSVDDTFSISSR